MSKPKAIKPKPAPKFNSILGDPPAVLRGHALQVWEDTAAELQTAGIGTRVEANALSCYCQAIADFHAAQAEIDRLGLVVITERGAVKNPAVTIKNQAMLMIHKFASSFGLTPASRDRVAFTAPKDHNPFEALMKS
jgi:P27 family predicted phage terminase small subunit